MAQMDDLPAGVLISGNGAQFTLTDGLTIGRAPDAVVRLDDAAVSREHAQLRHHDARWWVLDRGSRNGTRLNDTMLPAFAEHPLRDGDRIFVATHCFRVQVRAWLDEDETASLRLADVTALSAYQLQVVKALAEPWLRGHEPASNAEIAAGLGTPNAVSAVKAALRRCYVKAGVADLPTHTKRRELCRIASTSRWI